MKKLLTLLLLTLPVALTAQTKDTDAPSCGTYTTYYYKNGMKSTKKWAKRGKWRNGFTKADPDKTVNLVEFRQQVERNPEQWNALFAWLQRTDLTALPKGKHPIEGTTMVASVEDDTSKPLAERKSESHRRKIDFQYVVSGSEGFALLDHGTSTPNMEYNEAKDLVRYDFQTDRTYFFTNTEGCFNIFFPCDWHIAKVLDPSQPDAEAKPFRVVVIKVDYKE